MDALITRFLQPGDEVFSTREKLHIAGRIEELERERNNYKDVAEAHKACFSENIKLSERIEQLEAELFEQRRSLYETT